jgi:hypothetical protein
MSCRPPFRRIPWEWRRYGQESSVLAAEDVADVLDDGDQQHDAREQQRDPPDELEGDRARAERSRRSPRGAYRSPRSTAIIDRTIATTPTSGAASIRTRSISQPRGTGAGCGSPFTARSAAARISPAISPTEVPTEG